MTCKQRGPGGLSKGVGRAAEAHDLSQFGSGLSPGPGTLGSVPVAAKSYGKEFYDVRHSDDGVAGAAFQADP